MKVLWCSFFVLAAILSSFLTSLQAEELFLRNNLQKAQPGDYIVIVAGKTQTLMHISNKANQILTIEEIAVPECKISPNPNWKEWVAQGAPGNSSWVMFDIDLHSGQMLKYYSFTKRNWFEIPDADNFLSKLLNLKFVRIPNNARKKAGPKGRSGPDNRPLWQPRMIVEGKVVQGVVFDAWRTRWPKDGGELSGKLIEIYLPQDNEHYLAYFPYWLQINGTIGKAKIRMIDSGSGLKSPKQFGL